MSGSSMIQWDSNVELENAPFKCAKDADAWARSHDGRLTTELRWRW